MDTQKLRLIAFDMDNTVLADGAEITPRLQSILLRAMEQGIQVIPCTGRGRRQMPRTLEALPLLYTITSNGGLIRDEKQNQTIYSNLIDWQTTAGILHDLAAFGVFFCVHIDQAVYFECSEERYVREKYHIPDYMPVDLTENAEQLVRTRREGAEKIFLRTDDDILREEIRRSILEKYPVFCSSSSAHNLEFGVPGCSKGTALRWLCEHLGIKGSDVVAFGDGENDKEMLQFAGRGLAVANAQPACKEAADAVIGSCAGDGVAEYLEGGAKGTPCSL